MGYPLLQQVNDPQQLKALPADRLEPLCEEIRQFLIENVSKTGGHLSSNLGTIELTVALHRAFSTPQDKFVFDVGHQCYTHKILTGRREQFGGLRQLGGISGFPNPRESVHDAFVAGHGNTAISVAIGMAQAKKIKGEPGKVIALVGDGAFTGGMVYEGMNNIDTLNNLIVILNDNKMSISKNVGSLARYLTQLRTNPEYSKAKANLESVLGAIPGVGASVVRVLQAGKALLRRGIYHSTMFEEMGFQYLGPVDGHDVLRLSELFTNLQTQYAPVFIHAITVKGKGFKPAEENPGEFHGVSSFDPAHITDPDVAPDASFSTQFGNDLVELAKTRPNICAITAAMKYGTGLQFFYRRFPERFFDVGMAEQHAVTFAAGLASQGMLPVVAIYSTFLQRSYDQLIHDVKLMNNNVVLAIDRAGLVPGDGETHQGIYDTAFLSQIGIPVYAPCNYAELDHWLTFVVDKLSGPRAIRYPRGGQSPTLEALGCTGSAFDCCLSSPEASVALVSYGSMTEEVLAAAEQLRQQGVNADVYKLVQLYPLPEGLCEALLRYPTVLFAEDSIAAGGIGEHLARRLAAQNYQGRYIHKGISSRQSLPHATVPQIRNVLGLDGAGLAALVCEEQHIEDPS